MACTVAIDEPAGHHGGVGGEAACRPSKCAEAVERISSLDGSGPPAGLTPAGHAERCVVAQGPQWPPGSGSLSYGGRKQHTALKANRLVPQNSSSSLDVLTSTTSATDRQGRRPNLFLIGDRKE